MDVSYEVVFSDLGSVNKMGNSVTPAVIEFIGNILHKNSALNNCEIYGFEDRKG